MSKEERINEAIGLMKEVLSKATPFYNYWDFDTWDYSFDGQEVYSRLQLLLGVDRDD